MIKRVFNLTGVELSKIIRQRIFYIALALIVITVAVSVFIDSPEGVSADVETLDFLDETETETPVGRPDGGFGVLTKACLNGFGIAVVFLVIFASLSVSSEATRGTLRMILIRPIRRSELFLAKALSLIIIALIIIILIECVAFSMVSINYGFSDVVDPSYPDTPFEQGAKSLMLRYTLYSFILVALPIVSAIFFGLFISTIIENSGIAVALAILVYLVMDYLFIGLFDNLAKYIFSYYNTFYFDKLRDLSSAVSNSSWAFEVINEWLGLGTGEIKNSALYEEVWQPAVLKSILIPIGYIILFTIPSLIILKKKDVLV